jgi:hypothetical protein
MMVSEGIKDIDVKMPEDVYDNRKDVPTFNAYLTIIVKDSNDKVIQVHRQRSHSPTANFIGLLLPIIYFVETNGPYTLTNTLGGTCSYQPSFTASTNNIAYPNSGGTNYPTYLVGIQVGSGQQSNPYNAFTLAAPIANGTGAGQLVYGYPSVPGGVAVSGNSVNFYITQALNNQSGNTINFTEVSVIVQVQLVNQPASSSTNCGQILVWYDVLSSPISVPNGGSVVIYYTFTVNP